MALPIAASGWVNLSTACVTVRTISAQDLSAAAADYRIARQLRLQDRRELQSIASLGSYSQMHEMSKFRVLLLLLGAAPLGCTVVTTVGGERLRITSDAFQSYAEDVFRQQNSLATDIAFALEAEDLSAADQTALAIAEDSLLGACADLNEVAARRRDQRARRIGAQALAARRIPDCEQALLSVRDLLGRLER